MGEEELKSLGKDDEVVEQYQKKVSELNHNPNFINTITKERERVLMHNTALELAYENGEATGINIGISQGEKQKQLEIAKNLITIGLSDKQISDATGLSVQEIEKLKESKK